LSYQNIIIPVMQDFCQIHAMRGRHCRDPMVVGFTITYAISAYHYWCCELESRSGRGVQHYVIKFVSDLRHVGGFLWVFRFPSTNNKWPPRYCWNIVESGVKHHTSKPIQSSCDAKHLNWMIFDFQTTCFSIYVIRCLLYLIL
jgi:hypothetical protein